MNSNRNQDFLLRSKDKWTFMIIFNSFFFCLFGNSTPNYSRIHESTYQPTFTRWKVKPRNISLPNLTAFSFARGQFFYAIQLISPTTARHCGFFGCILHVVVSSQCTPRDACQRQTAQTTEHHEKGWHYGEWYSSALTSRSDLLTPRLVL